MNFNILFFIMPFLFFFGISIQMISFYLCCILIPMVVFFKQKREIPSFFISVGFLLIFLHIIFPITSLVNYVFPNTQMSSFLYEITLSWPGILKSDFPSSFFIGGIFLVIFTYFNNRRVVELKKTNLCSDSQISHTNIEPIKYFLMGLFFSSIVFALAYLYQHISGLNFPFKRHISLYVSEGNRFPNGTYRVYGYYGHPLTLASIGLAYATFTWVLFWQYISKKSEEKMTFIPFSSYKYMGEFVLIVSSLLNFAMVFLSGGRTASIICICVFLLVPILLSIKKNKKVLLLTLLSITLVSYYLGNKVDIYERISPVISSFDKSKELKTGSNRDIFWEVYMKIFKDKPIFGQGNYWLEKGLRTEYYDKMGFKNLDEKFNAHNMYLEILATVGLFGVVWILLGAYYFLLELKYKILKNEFSIFIMPFCLMFFVNILHSLTQNVFFDSSVDYVYLLVLFVLMWNTTLKSAYSTNVNTNSLR